jgi:hypothetical protein
MSSCDWKKVGSGIDSESESGSMKKRKKQFSRLPTCSKPSTME